MEIVHADTATATKALSMRISKELERGRVLWLLSGGSNVSIAVEALRQVRTVRGASRLTLALVDERYGPAGHADSNWQQLLDAGLPLDGVTAIPVLKGRSLEDTAAQYASALERAWAGAFVLAQLGIGEDGHIAGVLPHSPGVESAEMVVVYEAPPRRRITLTLAALTRVSAAYASAFGASKQTVLARLGEHAPLAEMPAQVLKEAPEAYLYTDQFIR